MPYPEYLIAPMRGEMTEMGAQGAADRRARWTSREEQQRHVMLVVNSVCGCAAGKARPGIAMALRNTNRPDVVATVFAGADIEATDRARQYFTGYAPSSPSIGLLRDGKLVYMMERSQIESRNAEMIAAELTQAFDKFCVEADARRPRRQLTRAGASRSRLSRSLWDLRGRCSRAGRLRRTRAGGRTPRS